MRRFIYHFLLGILTVPLFVVSCRKHLPDNGTTGPDLLNEQDKAHIFELLDAFLRDRKTKKAYAS
jgi:hypothetical protein